MKRLILAAAAMGALLVAGPADAQRHWRGHGRTSFSLVIGGGYGPYYGPAYGGYYGPAYGGYYGYDPYAYGYDPYYDAGYGYYAYPAYGYARGWDRDRGRYYDRRYDRRRHDRDDRWRHYRR